MDLWLDHLSKCTHQARGQQPTDDMYTYTGIDTYMYTYMITCIFCISYLDATLTISRTWAGLETNMRRFMIFFCRQKGVNESRQNEIHKIFVA